MLIGFLRNAKRAAANWTRNEQTNGRTDGHWRKRASPGAQIKSSEMTERKFTTAGRPARTERWPIAVRIRKLKAGGRVRFGAYPFVPARCVSRRFESRAKN